MSDKVECCMKCGKNSPELQTDCVSFSQRYNTRLSVNGREVSNARGYVHNTPVTGRACADCARRAVKQRARASAIKIGLPAFIITFVAGSVLGAGIHSLIPSWNEDNYLLIAVVAALVAVVLGLLRFRRISALPDAFGVAFLLDEKDPSHLDHLPCERALYPGVDLAAKKRAFIGFDTFSGTDGSILAEQIWEQNTH